VRARPIDASEVVRSARTSAPDPSIGVTGDVRGYATHLPIGSRSA